MSDNQLITEEEKRKLFPLKDRIKDIKSQIENVYNNDGYKIKAEILKKNMHRSLVNATLLDEANDDLWGNIEDLKDRIIKARKMIKKLEDQKEDLMEKMMGEEDIEIRSNYVDQIEKVEKQMNYYENKLSKNISLYNQCLRTTTIRDTTDVKQFNFFVGQPNLAKKMGSLSEKIENTSEEPKGVSTIDVSMSKKEGGSMGNSIPTIDL